MTSGERRTDEVEAVIMGLIMIGACLFGYLTAVQLGRFMDRDRNGAIRRPSEKSRSPACERKGFFESLLNGGRNL